MRSSWVEGAAGSDFDVDNLPLGIFSPPSESPRPGVAIGPWIADLDALAGAKIIDEPSLAGARTLNAFLGRGRRAWSALRARLHYLLSERAGVPERTIVESALVPRAGATMHLPVDPGDYVDFYSSIDHATNVGLLFRPDDPVGPNFRQLPIGYHGRTSTIVVDGTLIARPAGQRQTADGPVFGPTQALDFELEMAFVTGPGNAHGVPIPIGAVRDHAFGYVLLNDWSARDVQSWEMTPLGPHLGKSFATSISPWIVSLDALEPFRVDNRVLDVPPLPYLRTAERWAFDIELEVFLITPAMRAAGREPLRIVRSNLRTMYWNLAQQLAHLTSNGARIRPGDVCGTGTISGPVPESRACLLEITRGGREPLELPDGERRTYLADGDTVILRGRAAAGDRHIGFGEVTGTIVG